MSEAPRRLSPGQMRALKFAAHRQLARWAKQRELQPRRRAQRAELVRAVRILEDPGFTHGCDLRAIDEE